MKPGVDRIKRLSGRSTQLTRKATPRRARPPCVSGRGAARGRGNRSSMGIACRALTGHQVSGDRSMNRSPYVKDGINNYIVHGRQGTVNPDRKGTKGAAHYRLTVEPGQCRGVRLRLSDLTPASF